MLRSIHVLLILTFILVSCTASDEVVETEYTVGIVNPVAMREPVVEAFKAAMADLGYVEAQNIKYFDEGAIVDPVERAEWVQMLVESKVDLIVGIATPGAISAKQGTEDIPIIFFPVTDPVGSNLVESLQTPGGNATGVTNGNPHPLRLQLLLQLDPTIEMIYAPYDQDSPPAISTVPSILETADELGVEMILRQVRTDDEIDAAIENIPPEADAIFAMPDPRVADRWREWSRVAVAHDIPYSGLSYEEVEGGVLMAYGEELDAVGQQAARMADSVLRGTPPADLPVQTAEFFLSINIQTADEMGLIVPDSILQRATFIVYPSKDGS